jgi:hypothetical protein
MESRRLMRKSRITAIVAERGGNTITFDARKDHIRLSRAARTIPPRIPLCHKGGWGCKRQLVTAVPENLLPLTGDVTMEKP